MSATFTELVRRVRSRAGGGNSVSGGGPWSDTDIAEWITEAIAELHELLITSYGEDFMCRTLQANIAAGAGELVLTSQFLGDWQWNAVDQAWQQVSTFSGAVPWRVLRIDWANGTPGTHAIPAVPPDTMPGPTVDDEITTVDPTRPLVPLRRMQITNDLIDKTARDWMVYEPRYDLRFDRIVFNPRNLKAVCVRVYYVPEPQVCNPAALTEELALQYRNHERYIITSAAIAARDKEESDASTLIALRDRIVAGIKSSVPPRDVGQPARIVDADRNGYLEPITSGSYDPLRWP